MRYRADPAGALIVRPLDTFVAVFHRPSGITHLLVPPAPEILGILGEGPLTADALLARLSADFALVDADPAALAERLDELIAAGLVAAV
ncbi:MAG TPA: HPr-rel-A system PqqD family peptide chaperone [Sphingomonas sp.]|jgi:PqqD family protein of HPr-rel-A system|nr:HPr-rel-A system PqqD family peptide chaperone [Sphingomonas sp.]